MESLAFQTLAYYVVDIVTVFVECVWTFFFVKHYLEVKHKIGAYLGIVIMSAGYTIFFHAVPNMPFQLNMVVGLIGTICYVVIVFRGDCGTKICYSAIVSVIGFAANNIVALLVPFINSENPDYLLMITQSRMFLQLAYWGVLTVIYILSMKILKPAKYLYTKMLQILIVLIALLGTIASGVVMNFSVLVEHTPQISQLTATANLLIMLLTLVMIWGMGFLGQTMQRNANLENEKQQLQVEDTYNRFVAQTIEGLQTWKHDYKNQLLSLSGYIANEDFEGANQYIIGLKASITELAPIIHTGKKSLDMLLTNKLFIAHSNQIKTQVSISSIEMLKIPEIELNSIIGNAFDNALEACLKVDSSDSRFISLNFSMKKQMYYMRFENSSLGDYVTNIDGTLLSSKQKDSIGYGLSRIQSIAKEHQGFCQVQPGGSNFVIEIVLPIE